MKRSILLAACATLAGAPAACVAFAATPAAGATLRAFRALSGPSVRLSDLFGDMAAPDRVLGGAPAPGQRITVQAPQLAAIARDYGVDWRPVTGAEQSVLERAFTQYTQTAVLALLRPRLLAAGAPADAAILLPDFAPPALPAGIVPQATLADTSYDPASSHFTATLTLATADAPPLVIALSGHVVPMVDATVLTQPLHAGSILAAEDVRAARLPAASLHGATPLHLAAVLGLALRRDTAPGQPLTPADLTRPVLVARNAAVHMVLSAGAIALSAGGVALEDGAMNAHIRVQNPSSRAIMLAEVTGADEVRIMPGHAPIQVAAP